MIKRNKNIVTIFIAILMILSSLSQNLIAFAEDEGETTQGERDSYKITLEDTENGTLVFKDNENTREKEFKIDEDFNIVFKADEGYTIDSIVLKYKQGGEDILSASDEHNDIELKALTDYSIKANFKKIDETVKKRTKRSANSATLYKRYHLVYSGVSSTWAFTLRTSNGGYLTATCIQPHNQRIPEEGSSIELYSIPAGTPLSRLAYIGSQRMPLSKMDYYTIGRAGAVVGGYGIDGYIYPDEVNALIRQANSNLAVPSNFESYVGIPYDKSQEMLAFTQTPPKGYIKVVKKSALPNITDGNKCYSLEGARYEVRNSSGSWVDTIETDSNGVGYSNELDTGSYTIREIHSPKGYKLDENNHRVSVTSDNSTKSTAVVVNSLEQPKNDPSRIEITKIFNGAKTPTIPSLEGTQFTINYYDGYYTESNLPSRPTRSWIVEVKKLGDKYMTLLRSDYLVSGSPFYTNDLGVVTLPLGTVSIQETKPAFGYTLDGYISMTNGSKISTRKPLVTQITEKTGGAYIKAGNVFSGKNDPVYGSIELTKVNTHNQVLAGATFRLTNSKGQVVSDKTSDSRGKVKWDNLYPDRYTVTEIKSPKGYQLLAKPIIIDVPSKYTSIQLREAGISTSNAKLNNGKYGDNLYYVWDMKHKVVNSKSFRPANTGGKGDFPYATVGILVLVPTLLVGFFLAVKKNKKNK